MPPFVTLFRRWELYLVELPRRFAILPALMMIGVTYLVQLLLFCSTYETNDDAVMNLFAAGQGLATAPDEHLVFTHPWIGHLLKFLYTWLPQFPWYGWYLMATQIAAHTALASVLLTGNSRRRAYVALAVWQWTVGLHLLTHLQFTTTAALAGLAGVLLVWTGLGRIQKYLAPKIPPQPLSSPDHRAQDIATNFAKSGFSPVAVVLYDALPWLAAGWLFWCWAVMIRWYTLEMWVVLAAPVVACWLLIQRARPTTWAVAAAVGVLFGGSGVALRQIHIDYYHNDPAWAGFFEYNELRAQFNDLLAVRYTPESAASFHDAGWSLNDLNMIVTWCYDDPRVFSTEKLRQIYHSRNWQVERLGLPDLPRSLEPLWLDRRIWTLVVLLAGVLVFLAWEDQQRLLTALAAIVVAGALIGGLTLLRKTPPRRVYYPIAVWPLAAAGWLASRRKATDDLQTEGVGTQFGTPLTKAGTANAGWAPWLAGGAATLWLAGAILPEVYQQYAYSRRQLDLSREFKNDLAALNFQSDQLYVFWGAQVPLDLLRPTDNLQWLGNLRAIMLGWSQQTPLHAQMKAKFGVKNLLAEWTDHPQVRVICYPTCCELFANYAWQHDRQAVGYRPLADFRGNIIVRFETVREVTDKPVDYQPPR
ncbi:MAG: hypothetical protein SFX18_09395 [Pirellulales bacterium]|nr:hypothetical protein [Pirellulales bacterium]